jgi:CBS domain-containing protein
LTLTVGVDAIMHLIPQMMLKRPKTENEVTSLPEMTLQSLLTTNGKEGLNPWLPVEEGLPLRSVIQLLATKTRRVPVISKKTGRVIQIISQSQITTLMYEYCVKEKLLEKDTINKSGFGLKPVFKVKESAPVREAFQVMVDKQISSVVIVSDKGDEIISCISTKDIRLLPRLESVAIEHSVLDLSCIAFIQLIRKEDYKTHAALVHVDLNCTLLEVLGKLAATKMHRVYIVNKLNQPVGVVSVSDVVVALQSSQPK